MFNYATALKRKKQTKNVWKPYGPIDFVKHHRMYICLKPYNEEREWVLLVWALWMYVMKFCFLNMKIHFYYVFVGSFDILPFCLWLCMLIISLNQCWHKIVLLWYFNKLNEIICSLCCKRLQYVLKLFVLSNGVDIARVIKVFQWIMIYSYRVF